MPPDPCNLVLLVELMQESMLWVAKEIEVEKVEAKVLEAWKLPAKNLLAEKEKGAG